MFEKPLEEKLDEIQRLKQHIEVQKSKEEELRIKIEKTPDAKKEEVLLEILDTYDSKDPKIKMLLKKYSPILEKHIKPEKIKISIA